jgi:hypothetical protein
VAVLLAAPELTRVAAAAVVAHKAVAPRVEVVPPVAAILPVAAHPVELHPTKASSRVRAGAVDRPVEPQGVPPAPWAPQAAARVARLDRWAARQVPQAAQLAAQPARWARPVVQRAAAVHKAAVRRDPWDRPAAAKAARRVVIPAARAAPLVAERTVRKAVVVVAAAVR